MHAEFRNREQNEALVQRMIDRGLIRRNAAPLTQVQIWDLLAKKTEANLARKAKSTLRASAVKNS